MILYPTQLAYYDDPYLRELNTEVLKVAQENGKLVVILDSTIFFPFGGGQPSDQGSLKTVTGTAEVVNVQINGGVVKHECNIVEGSIEEGQQANLILDWERRHWNMRVHTAGHIIHDILVSRETGLNPVKGNHGSKPFLEYRSSGQIKITQSELQDLANAKIGEDLAVTTRETDIKELEKIAEFISPNLPRDKNLRMIQIEGFKAMPDGGTQVKSLGEIGKVEITSLNQKEDTLTLKYRVLD